MSIQLYNSLGRGKEPFEPLEAGKVRMYVCGPTAYDSCHIGHARSVVVFDVISRYLADLPVSERGRVYLLTREGNVLASSDSADTGDRPILLTAAVDALDTPVGAQPVGQPAWVTFDSEDSSSLAALEVFEAAGLEWATAVIVPLSAIQGEVDRITTLTIAVAGGFVGIALLFGGIAVVRRRRRLRIEARRVFSGEGGA